MEKQKAAVRFFEQLISGPSDFVTTLIDAEMDAELIEVFNKFGSQLQQGEIERERFQASLLIIGYLVRAHEQSLAALESLPPDQPLQ